MLKSINRRRLLALGISLPLAGKLMSQDTISQTGVEILFCYETEVCYMLARLCGKVIKLVSAIQPTMD